MSKDAAYIKGDKIYKTRKAGWRPRRITLWLLLPLVIFLVLGGYCIFSGIGVEDEGTVGWSIDGKIDYKVYLKDNDYYEEKYLGPNM